MESFFESRSGLDRMFSMKDFSIDDPLQQHLARVYSSLAGAVFFAAVGAWAHMQYHIGGMLCGFISIILIFFLSMNRDQTKNTQRLGLLAAIGFFNGASIGPLIELAMQVDSSLIVTAFIGTTTIFLCLTLSAFFARRFSMLALGGLLSSGLSLLLLMSFIGMFFRSAGLFWLQIYLGLIILCGYVMFDTQMIMERFRMRNDTDYIWHAVELFVDFIGIFVRILIILLRNAEKDKRKRRS